MANVYRLYCDSLGIPCISLERGLGIDSEDVATIDLSPLRMLSIGFAEIASSIVTEARREDEFRYSSLRSVEDKSDLGALGWEVDSSVWTSDAVWRLPAVTVACVFTDRGESKRFAQSVASRLTGGTDFQPVEALRKQ